MIGAEDVMRVTEEYREAAAAEDAACVSLKTVVKREINRQRSRGEMAKVAWRREASSGTGRDTVGGGQGMDRPLSTVERDHAWENGGWVASAARHRRRKREDGGPVGGPVVKKVNISMKSGDGNKK